jgi:hypothetical protein
LRTSTLLVLLGSICVMGALSQAVRQEQRGTVSPPSPAEDSLRAFLKNHLRVTSSGNRADTRYREAFVDLNGDGRPEAIVYITGSAWCGSGGCLTLILAQAGSSYRVVSRITITRPPVCVLPHTSNGWRDIAVRVQGGSTQPGHEAELRFDGKAYPENPSVLPARILSGGFAGDVVIHTSGQGKSLDP